MNDRESCRILQVTTYPIDNPDHGGKLRCHYIRKKLREESIVETLSFDFTDEESVDGFAVKLNKDKFLSEIGHGYLMDWGINTYLEKEQQIKEQVFDLVNQYSPHILVLEQPFLWPLLQEMKDKGVVSDNVFTIYSSHNVEVDLKRSIYKDIFSDDDYKKNIEIVQNIELEVAKNADLSLAVSDLDVNYLKSVAPLVPVLLYQNGHAGMGETPQVEKWKKKFLGAKYNWIFIGSWHGPNINGLVRLLQGGLLDLNPKDVCLWVFGGAGLGLKNIMEIEGGPDMTIQIIGPSSQEDIDSAIVASSGIVLPIWEGGGSNLKTAQALLSGKTVVATSYSFRGVEHHSGSDGVYLYDQPREMVKALGEMNVASYDRSEAFEELHWASLLKSLPHNIQLHRAKR